MVFFLIESNAHIVCMLSFGDGKFVEFTSSLKINTHLLNGIGSNIFHFVAYL